MAIFVGAPRSARSEAVKVRVEILVIEASKSLKSFDPKIEAKLAKVIQEHGHTGAQVLDELTSNEVAQGESVSLEILRKSEKARMLKVTVLEVKPELVRLRVGIREFKFKTETKHLKGGTIMVAFKGDGKTMYLAVTPKQ